MWRKIINIFKKNETICDAIPLDELPEPVLQEPVSPGPVLPDPSTNAVDANQISMQEYKIFVGGLNRRNTKEIILQYFSRWGQIISVEVPLQRNKPRGFAFVTFASRIVVDEVQRQPHQIDGVTVEIKRAIPNLADDGGRGRRRPKRVCGPRRSLTDDRTFHACCRGNRGSTLLCRGGIRAGGCIGHITRCCNMTASASICGNMSCCSRNYNNCVQEHFSPRRCVCQNAKLSFSNGAQGTHLGYQRGPTFSCRFTHY